MRRGQRRRLIFWLFLSVLGGAVGFVYGYTISLIAGTDEILARSWSMARAGLLITAFSAGFELFLYQAPAGAFLRRKPFLIALGLRILCHVVLVLLAILINRSLTYLFFTYYFSPPIRLRGRSPFALARDLFFTLAVVAFFALLLEFRALIGGRTFNSIVLGRYHRPRRERRIFLFVDIKGSAALTAEIGDEQYQALLARLFFELDEIVVDYGGEVHTYVGDLMVATWSWSDPERNARAVAAVFAMQDHLAARCNDYRGEFGVVPGLWASLHGGEVVTGEYGGSKRQIAYFGDVINATARIEGLAKSLDRDFVVSEPLLDQIALPATLKVVPEGVFELRGTLQNFNLYSLAR